MLSEQEKQELREKTGALKKKQESFISARPKKIESSTASEGNSWQYYGIGFDFIITIGVFTTIGYFIDKKLESSPWVMVALLVIGFISAFVRLLKTVNRMNGD